MADRSTTPGRDRIDSMMDRIDAQREQSNREQDIPHPDRRMAYQWTYPCKACGQMMKITWDSSNGYPDGGKLYHNCEHTVDDEEGGEDARKECGAFYVFPLDWWIEITLKGGILACSYSEMPLDRCDCDLCLMRRKEAGEIA